MSKAKPVKAAAKTKAKTLRPTRAKLTKLERHYVPLRSKDAIWRTNPDGTVSIMKIDNAQYFLALTHVPGEFWKRIDGKTNVGKIKDALIKQYKPPQPLFDEAFGVMLNQLSSENVIKWHTGE